MHIQIELSALPDALIRNRSAGRSRRNNQPYRSVHRNPPRILAIVPEPLGLPRLMEIPGEKLVKTQSLCIRIDAGSRAILSVASTLLLLPFAPSGHFWIQASLTRRCGHPTSSFASTLSTAVETRCVAWRLVVCVGGKRNRKRTIDWNVVFVKVKRAEDGGRRGVDGKWKRSNEFSFVSHADDGRIVFSLFVRDARRFCVTYLVKETRETDNPQPTNRDCPERRRSLFSQP